VTILMSNVAAAMGRTSLSARDLHLLDQYARETASNYCAGCSNICQTALAEDIPVADVMRYLMYHQSYDDYDRARSLYARLSPDIRERIGNVDYSLAENRCPQGIPIGKAMRKAQKLLA
ncbi:MAG: aldo/keto reductase, partial [Deltaproteobacteria bacterium]|nr:aldo/keto reductase [Deltaproteobacteria bacterium]